MPQIFHPSMNYVAKTTIFGGIFILAGAAWCSSLLVRSSYVTQVNVVRDQPIPFSHDHHVSGLGLDCRYCHSTVEKSAYAGMPATETCMGCHAEVWRDTPLLEPLRASLRNDQPLSWTRVYDLPDYVYFDHGIHVNKGIGCQSCHGDVDRMPLMRKAVTLHMEWCLQCHRNPEPALRPHSDIFTFSQQKSLTASDAFPAEAHDGIHGPDLLKHYHIVTDQLTDCTICHR